MWFSARVASVSRRGPASNPASCNSRAKAPNRGRRSGSPDLRTPPRSAGRWRAAPEGTWSGSPDLRTPPGSAGRWRAAPEGRCSGSGTSCLLDHRRNLLADPLQIFLVLERGAESCIHQCWIDARRAEGSQRARPIEGLRHAWHLVEVHTSKPLHQCRHLAGKSIGSFRSACPHDLDLLLEVRVVDPVVETSAFERVVHLTGPV